MNDMIEITSLLHKHGTPDHPRIQELLARNADSRRFQERAQVAIQTILYNKEREHEMSVL